MLKINDRVRLIDGTITTIVGIENEPISLNKIYLIDKQYKGKYDDKYGYNREYYKEGTWFVYPSEIVEKVESGERTKIDIYTLLGLVKDGKAPKKIEYNGDVYFLKSDGIFEFFAYKTIDYNKFNTDGERLGKVLFLDNCYMHLYDEVKIIEKSKRGKEED